MLNNELIPVSNKIYPVVRLPRDATQSAVLLRQVVCL